MSFELCVCEQNGEDATVATAGAVQMTSLKKDTTAAATTNGFAGDVMKRSTPENEGVLNNKIDHNSTQAISPCWDSLYKKKQLILPIDCSSASGVFESTHKLLNFQLVKVIIML